MRVILVFCFFFFLFARCNKTETDKFTEVIQDLDQQKIYVVFRETDSKNGIVSKNYNVTSSTMTHVGIGFFDPKKKFKVYHIDLNAKDKDTKKNDIIISPITEFFNPTDCEVLGGEVWEYNKNYRKEKFVTINNYIDSMSLKTNIKFDIDFDYEDSNKLYCSELVSKFLEKFSSYKPHLITKKVNNLQRLYLKKDSIKYVPVDYFMQFSCFQQVYKFKKEA
jgi:hypothetical protein